MAVALGLLAGGCTPHATLTAPPKSAPAQERVKAYNDLSYVGADADVTETVSGGGVQISVRNYWLLGDGTKIWYPLDLAQVVSPDSPTAKSFDAYLHADEQFSTLKWTTLAVLLGGVALGLTALETDSWILGAAGGAAIVASPIMYMTYRFQLATVRGQHILDARNSYNDDLADNLGVELTLGLIDADDPRAGGSRGADGDDGTSGFIDTLGEANE